MESLAQGPAAEEHGPRLPRTLELGWHVGAHPSRTVHGGARAGRPGAEPDSSHYQLADSQRLAKRGAWLDPSGYDAGKKIKGRKRHILVDTLGLLLNVVVHPADVQDRVLSTCCAGHDAYSRSSNSFLLMADMPDPKWH